MPVGSVEQQFAQRLASNEKIQRDRAVRKLKRWLNARSAVEVNVMTKDEMLRLWKGLFYCMWMADKPLVQEEVADNLSDLITCFLNDEAALLFIDGFFETIQREWAGIDYLRIDKFMMLVRRFLSSCFKWLNSSAWDSTRVNGLLEVLKNNAISTEKENAGVGLQLHVADIYLEELAKVAADKISGKDLTKFFIPYCELLGNCICPSLRKTIIKRIFEFSLRLSDDSDDEQDDMDDTENAEDGGAGDSDADSSEADERKMHKGRRWRHRVRNHNFEAEALPFPKFDYQDIGDTLLDVVGKANIKLKHLTEVYETVKLFHEMATGIFPLDSVERSVGPGLRRKEIATATKRLLEENNKLKRETESWRKSLRRFNKKIKSGNDVDSDEEDEKYDDDDDSVDAEIDSDSDLDSDAVDEDDDPENDLQQNDEPSANANIKDENTSGIGNNSDKLLQRLIEKQNQAANEPKSTKRKREKIPKLIPINGDYTSSSKRFKYEMENNINNSTSCVDSETLPVEDSTKIGQPDPVNSVSSDVKNICTPEDCKSTLDSSNNLDLSIDQCKTESCDPETLNTSSEKSNGKASKSAKRRKARKGQAKIIKVTESTNGIEKESKLSDKISCSSNATDSEVQNKLSSSNSVVIASDINSENVGINRIPKEQNNQERAKTIDTDVTSQNAKLSKKTSNSVKSANSKFKVKSKMPSGHRYFEVPDAKEAASVRVKSVKAKTVKMPVKATDNGVEFDTFMKNPPVFFRTAVSKVSPKILKRKINTEASASHIKDSAKKVSFVLQRNCSQGVKDYFDSVRNSPSVPFKADSLPAQGVLKTKCQKTQVKKSADFLSLNVTKKQRAVAKDFFNL